MEVQSFTKPREVRHKLKVRLSLINKHRNNFAPELFSRLAEFVDITVIAPHVEINFEDSTIHLLFHSKTTTLPLSSNNILTTLSFCRQYLFNQASFDSLEKKQETVSAQISKRNRRFQQDIKTKIKSLPALSAIIDTNNLFSQVTKIKNIPPTILSIDLFKAFQSSQLLVHEKGKQIAKTYLSNDHDPIKISEISASNFNNIYSQIKKSKNRLFNQTQTLQNHSEVLGTFLAKDYDLPSYRVVLIVSRNDFLPPSQEEQHYFNSFSEQLYSIYAKVLVQEKCSDKISKIKNALIHAPFPIVIRNSHGDTILENRQVPSKHHLKSYPLPLKYSMDIQISNDSNQYADAYHLQRITLLGELLNTLRHELGNPLFGIKLAANLLSSGTSDQECAEILSEIAKSCHRCQKIIEDFSFLYRDEGDLTQVDLRKVLNETFILAKSATQNIQREIKLCPNTENFFIQSHPTWISQIIFNLIINSSQALQAAQTLDPKITLEIKKLDCSFLISISDNGPGITSTIQEQIFEPFFTTKPKGTGLGLSICNNLAKKLGAKIFFQNNSHSLGVTFTLRLPEGK